MKKLLCLIIMPLVMLSITSCSGNRYLDRPDNTNLTYWITQKVNENDFDDCTYLPGWFGANEYLDGRYAAIEEEGSVVRAQKFMLPIAQAATLIQ